MNLFIDCVSKNWKLILFTWKDIFSEKNLEIAGNEISTLPSILQAFLEEHSQQWENIENIVVVTWPGSFTAIRAIILVINTLAFTFPNISLTPIHYFDLFDTYPIVKTSSKRDVFLKPTADGEVIILQNEELRKYLQERDIQTIFWEPPIGEEYFWKLKFVNTPNYTTILETLVLKKEKFVNPLYIKKPSIS